MTRQPNLFGNHYYVELLNGGGAFPSDKALLTDPDMRQWVRKSPFSWPELAHHVY